LQESDFDESSIMVIVACNGYLVTLDQQGRELWRHVFSDLKTCQLCVLTTDECTATNPLSPMGNQRSVYVAGAGR